MNTTVKPDVDNIDALDFEPQCTGKNIRGIDQCQSPAVWAVMKHCEHVGFLCDPCKVNIDWNRRWKCGPCNKIWPNASLFIVELRRL